MRPNLLLIFLIIAVASAITATAITFFNNGFSPGYLQGKVTIGPLCPVERENASCGITPDYSSVKIIVQSGFSKQTVDVNFDGTYRMELSPGTYTVNAIHHYIRASGVPTEVTIKTGETVTVNIDIDTGIR